MLDDATRSALAVKISEWAKVHEVKKAMIESAPRASIALKMGESNRVHDAESRCRERAVNNEFYALLRKFQATSTHKLIDEELRLKQEVEAPFNTRCELIFKNLRKNLSKKYHIKLNKLERKMRRAIKPLFFQPSEKKNIEFQQKYFEILTEGEVVFKDEQNLWGDCIRPVLIDIANFVIAVVRFILSALIPSIGNYKDAFFSGPRRQTREEASHTWRQEVEAAQDEFYELADHAATLAL